MKNKLIYILPLTLMSLTGCFNSEVKGEVEITDMVGRTVEVNPGTYKKVVCIGAGALRLYSYIGDVNLLAGVEDIDNETSATHPQIFDNVARPYYIANKEVFDTLPSCGVGGPAAQAAESEKILACDPDIVLSLYEDVDKENALQEELGVPVVTLRYGSSGIFDSHVTDSITLLGKIFKLETKATTLNNYIAAQKQDIMNRVALVKDNTDNPKCYIGGLGAWKTTTHLYTNQTYEPFNVAGITNVVSGLTINGVVELEEEKFTSLGEDMDIMFLDAAAIKNIKTLYKADNTIFDSCKAWQNGEVYLELAYNCYYTNLELALVNTWFYGKTVYPSLFSDIDINTKMSEVTTAFLGKDLTTKINAYPFSYGGYQKIDTATFFN